MAVQWNEAESPPLERMVKGDHSEKRDGERGGWREGGGGLGILVASVRFN